MLSPKIHRNSMLPPRCPQPPCRNIDVKQRRPEGQRDVRRQIDAGRELAGTTPQAKMKAWTARSGRLISIRNATTFRGRSAIVTKRCRLSFSSPIGNMVNH